MINENFGEITLATHTPSYASIYRPYNIIYILNNIYYTVLLYLFFINNENIIDSGTKKKYNPMSLYANNRKRST